MILLSPSEGWKLVILLLRELQISPWPIAPSNFSPLWPNPHLFHVSLWSCNDTLFIIRKKYSVAYFSFPRNCRFRIPLASANQGQFFTMIDAVDIIRRLQNVHWRMHWKNAEEKKWLSNANYRFRKRYLTLCWLCTMYQ